MEQVSSQSQATGGFGVREQPDKNPPCSTPNNPLTRNIDIEFVCEKPSLFVCPPTPPTTRRTVMVAYPSNLSTTLPHVKTVLTDPAAAGAPPSRCHCQCAPTTPPHCSRTFTSPPPWRCHCQRAPTTLPHCPRTSTAPTTSRCHCQRARLTQRHTTASAYTLTTGLTPVAITRRTRRGR